MSRQTAMPNIAFGNSVFAEICRDFRATLKAVKRVLGDKHMMTTVCLHACVFPTDRMSLRMVWDQFQALDVAQRADILQALRSRAM
jgi:hypothetical protein